MKTNIIAISSLKGGVGKSTVTINLGYNLSKMGKKVLLIDFDSQGDMTKGLGVSQPDNLDYTIAKMFYEEMFKDGVAKSHYEKYVCTYSDNLDYIPCNIEMADIEVNLSNTNILNNDGVLKRILEPLLHRYDYILIDSGRSLGNLLKNLLFACNGVIIPIEPSLFSVKGLQQLLTRITKSQRAYGNEIDCKGIVLNMYDGRTNFDKGILRELETSLPNKLFETVIPKSVDVKSSALAGIPISEYKRTNKVAIAFETFTREFVIRMEGLNE